MDNKITLSISDAVDKLIAHSTEEVKLNTLSKKHAKKVHFIPVKYRILGGILQSMNIQFGNFLENTISNIVALHPNNKITTQYSGKRSNDFRLSKKSAELIDEYILSCQTENYTEDVLTEKYISLLKQLIKTENEETETVKFNQDIDLLFRQTAENRYVYVEIKYNDDHDSDKFVGINRKFLKTFALLVRELGIKALSEIKPVLMYFNSKKLKGNIYLPENLAIYRGKKFFDIFTQVNYDDIDSCFKNISESRLLNEKFDSLCSRILGETVHTGRN